MKDKIVHLMKSEGLTSSRLAEILEIQPSGISHIVSGRNKPGFDLLQKILKRFPQINPDWLLLDSPNIYRDEVAVESSDGELHQGEDFLPIDLFDMASATHGNQNRNFSDRQRSENGDKLSANQGAKRGLNFQQNSPQNAVQNTRQFQGSSPSVERIIILYSDNTFRTYDMR
ncbi:MAG: helix-turn-helix transcriptional regulator [Rikenellaceae bacterium]